MLLNERIVYLGTGLAPEVTELIVAELLYLNFEGGQDPIMLYINSPGSAGFETEAFAILDTMNYVVPDIHTMCLGSCFGSAAMLLASGKRGCRQAMPNSVIMLHQPRSQARGQASDIKVKAVEVLKSRNTINEILAVSTGQTIETINRDTARTLYFNPDQAKAYGVIDKVLRSDDELLIRPSFLDAL